MPRRYVPRRGEWRGRGRARDRVRCGRHPCPAHRRATDIDRTAALRRFPRDGVVDIVDEVLRPLAAPIAWLEEVRLGGGGHGWPRDTFYEPEYQVPTAAPPSLEVIEKLTLLIPPPRFHTLRFHGVLGPAAAWRSAVTQQQVRGAVGPRMRQLEHDLPARALRQALQRQQRKR